MRIDNFKQRNGVDRFTALFCFFTQNLIVRFCWGHLSDATRLRASHLFDEVMRYVSRRSHPTQPFVFAPFMNVIAPHSFRFWRPFRRFF